MDFNFNMPVRVIGGKGAVKNHKEIFSYYGRSCLIVCGEGSARLSGALTDLKAVLDELEITYGVFDTITQNPKTEDCVAAGKAARDYSAEFIVGIGGGSQLDAAKAAAVYASNKHLEADDIYTQPLMLPPLPVILIGTTAGTGSEVTSVSVLTKCDGKKKSVSGDNYYAKVAFADPTYTYSVPYHFTVSTAVDAFSHAVESLFSNKADSISREFAKAAIPVIWDGLKFFYENSALPTDAMRDELYYASLYAGMALNITGTCFPHTVGYVLTENYGMPHGFACGAFLPAFVRRALEFRNAEATHFLSGLGVSIFEFESIINALVDTSKVSMTAEQIEQFTEPWQNVKNFINTPGSFDKNDAKALLEELFLRN